MVLTYVSNSKLLKKQNIFHTDTDSSDIGIHNHASYCILNDKRHFISKVQACTNSKVDGVNGMAPIDGVGTIKCCTEDDSGIPQTFSVPHSLYVSKPTNTILLP